MRLQECKLSFLCFIILEGWFCRSSRPSPMTRPSMISYSRTRQMHAHLVNTPIPDTHFPRCLHEDVLAVDRTSVTFHGHFRNQSAAIRERHRAGVYSYLLASGSSGNRPSRFERTNHETSSSFITYSCTICVDVP